MHRIIKHYNLDVARLLQDLTDSLDRLPRGSTTISDLSADVEEAVERGWVFATLLYGETQVRTGLLIIGMLKNRSLAAKLTAISPQFSKVSPDSLSDDFVEIVKNSPETGLISRDGFNLTGKALPVENTGIACAYRISAANQ